MKNVSGNHFVPDDGFRYVTNGTTWAGSIYLGRTDNLSNWHDTNEEPPGPDDEVDDAEALGILLGGAI